MSESLKVKDYASFPKENGMFKMSPSGDIVNIEERNRRLEDFKNTKKVTIENNLYIDGINGVFGRTWEQIQQMQGGNIDILKKKGK